MIIFMGKTRSFTLFLPFDLGMIEFAFRLCRYITLYYHRDTTRTTVPITVHCVTTRVCSLLPDENARTEYRYKNIMLCLCFGSASNRCHHHCYLKIGGMALCDVSPLHTCTTEATRRSKRGRRIRL